MNPQKEMNFSLSCVNNHYAYAHMAGGTALINYNGRNRFFPFKAVLIKLASVFTSCIQYLLSTGKRRDIPQLCSYCADISLIRFQILVRRLHKWYSQNRGGRLCHDQNLYLTNDLAQTIMIKEVKQ